MAESANTNGPKQIDLYGLKTLLQTKIQDKLQSNKPNIIFLAGPSASGKSTVIGVGTGGARGAIAPPNFVDWGAQPPQLRLRGLTPQNVICNSACIATS